MAAPQKSGPKNETQIIYSMMGVTKEIDRKKILNNVSISYYYGAKIGVLAASLVSGLVGFAYVRASSSPSRE
mgnify:CR=1 FL=1